MLHYIGTWKVQFSAPNVGTVTLQPGEQAVVSANGTEKRTVDLDEYIGWVNGVYNFKNRSLGEIMETFERWYDIQIYYETPDLRDINLQWQFETLRNDQFFLGCFGTDRRSDL